MPDLEPIGVRAVIEGLDSYQNGLKKLEDSTKKTSDTIDKSGGKVEGLGKVFDGLTSKFAGMVTGSNGAAGAVGELGEMAGLAGPEILALAAPLAVVGAALAGFVALATRGAGFSELENAFGRLTTAVHLNANALLDDLSAAADGTISKMDLLTTVNKTLTGVTQDFGEAIGKQLPALMKIAQTQADATGQDTKEVFDAITEAIKRGQTRMLAGIGIVINQKQAFDEYAKSIHKTAEELTQSEKQQALLNATIQQGNAIAATMGDTEASNADKMAAAQASITNMVDVLAEAVQPVFSGILTVINDVLGAISEAVNAVAPYLKALAEIALSGLQAIWAPVKAVFGSLLGAPKTLGEAAKGFFTGGARMMGGLAKGIISAANTLIFPAIEFITQTIADFLVGMSPPPKGPLHVIDQGGYNVMSSWIQGFMDVPLDPVEEVAAQVSQAMGSIATKGIDQVKIRLAQLDQAIAPFQNRLDIMKAQFDAIKPAQEAAFRSIDRQIAQAQKALEAGDVNASETIKRLDAQREKLQGYVDKQQEQIDNAEIQLSLVKQQQSAERAMLDIRMKQLGPQKAAGAEKAKAGGGGGGGVGDAGEALGGGIGGGGGDFSLIDANKTASAKNEMMDAFSEGLGSDEAGGGPLGQMTDSVGKIKGNLEKIGSVDIGSKLKEKFSAAFDPSNPNSVFGQVKEWFLNTFDPERDGSIINRLAKLPEAIPGALNGLGTAFTNALNTAGTAVTTWISGIVDPAQPMSLPKRLTDLITVKIPDALKDVGKVLLAPFNLFSVDFGTWIGSLVDPAQVTSLPARLLDLVLIKIPLAFVDLPIQLGKALFAPFTTVFDDIVNRLLLVFTGSTANESLQWFIDQGIAAVAGIPDRLKEALKSLSDALKSALLGPVVAAINGVLTAIHGLIAGVLDGIKKFVSGLPEQITSLPGIKDLVSGIQNLTIPEFPKVGIPAAASGGMFSSGLLKVGERGEEYISSAEKIGVFPNSFVVAMNRLSGVMAQALPMLPSMTSYITNSRSTTYNNTFNGVQDGGEAVRRLAMMQAFNS